MHKIRKLTPIIAGLGTSSYFYLRKKNNNFTTASGFEDERTYRYHVHKGNGSDLILELLEKRGNWEAFDVDSLKDLNYWEVEEKIINEVDYMYRPSNSFTI